MIPDICQPCSDPQSPVPSGGMFCVGRCEVYTWTRSRGAQWMIVAQKLNRQCAITHIDEPTRVPVVDAVSRMGSTFRPFRAVLLRADDEGDAVVKALDYFQRVDEHVFGICGSC